MEHRANKRNKIMKKLVGARSNCGRHKKVDDDDVVLMSSSDGSNQNSKSNH